MTPSGTVCAEGEVEAVEEESSAGPLLPAPSLSLKRHLQAPQGVDPRHSHLPGCHIPFGSTSGFMRMT